jgi:DNA modification methylase
VELDPKYVDVIIRRWQQFTGKQAVLEGDGRTFDAVAKELRAVAA